MRTCVYVCECVCQYVGVHVCVCVCAHVSVCVHMRVSVRAMVAGYCTDMYQHVLTFKMSSLYTPL